MRQGALFVSIFVNVLITGLRHITVGRGAAMAFAVAFRGLATFGRFAAAFTAAWGRGWRAVAIFTGALRRGRRGFVAFTFRRAFAIGRRAAGRGRAVSVFTRAVGGRATSATTTGGTTGGTTGAAVRRGSTCGRRAAIGLRGRRLHACQQDHHGRRADAQAQGVLAKGFDFHDITP